MATVPGDPSNVTPMLPKWAQPTPADFLQAMSIIDQREKSQQMAGDVVSLIPKLGQKFREENLGGTERTQATIDKAKTARTLGRALGTDERVLQMTPKGD